MTAATGTGSTRPSCQTLMVFTVDRGDEWLLISCLAVGMAHWRTIVLIIHAGFISEPGNTELKQQVSHQADFVRGSHQITNSCEIPGCNPLSIQLRGLFCACPAMACGDTRCVKEAVIPFALDGARKGNTTTPYSQVRWRNDERPVARRTCQSRGAVSVRAIQQFRAGVLREVPETRVVLYLREFVRRCYLN
ncbi:hypothetical protein J3F83DRAFT_730695 [Trichoderma novae-zelandiae]